MSLGAGLLAYLGSALFHAVVHVTTHEVYHGIAPIVFRKKETENHHVAKALAVSFEIALDQFTKLHAATLTAPDRAALAALKHRSKDVFSPTDASAPEFLRVATAQEALRQGIQTVTPVDISRSLLTLLSTELPNLFVEAFREIGLKGSEQVRAVIVESMLHQLRESIHETHLELGAIRSNVETLLLNDQLLAIVLSRSMAQGFDRMSSSFGAALADIQGDQKALLDGQTALARRLEVLSSEPPVRGHLHIRNSDGTPLQLFAIRNADLTIGRSQNNSVPLASEAVSRHHARLFIDNPHVWIIDLDAQGGIWLDNRRLTTPEDIGFSTTFRIGPFLLSVETLDASLPPIMTPTTRRQLTAGLEGSRG